MMYTMQEEMEKQEDRFIGQIIVDMEQESVENVLQQGPHKITDKEAD